MWIAGVFVLMTLACARLTRLVVSDRLTLSWRQKVIKRFGEQSYAAYFIHCPWCVGMWISVVCSLTWAVYLFPVDQWWLAVPASFAMSHLVGLLSRLEG